MIFSGGPKSVHVPGAPVIDPGVYDARPARPRASATALSSWRSSSVARWRRPAGASTAGRSWRRTGEASVLLDGDQTGLDEPLRFDRAGPAGFAVTARTADVAVAVLEDSAADPRRPVPPGGRAHAGRPGDAPSASCSTSAGAGRPGRWRRSSTRRWRPCAARSVTAGPSAGCPAGWTRRSPRRSCTGPSDTS